MSDTPAPLRVPRPAQVVVPPTRHAFPVSTRPELEPLTLVTFGGPGWWVIDEVMVTGGPHAREGGIEVYEVLPLLEWGAGVLRGEGEHPVPIAIPTSQLWVYLDGVQENRYVDELGPASALAWGERMQKGSSSEPPEQRVPRPARELPSLTGRTVRLLNLDGEWEWAKALSEAIDDHGDITVSICAVSDYWRAVYSRPPRSATWIRRVALHRVWAY